MELTSVQPTREFSEGELEGADTPGKGYTALSSYQVEHEYYPEASIT